MTDKTPVRAPWLPDVCSGGALLNVIILAELFAVVIAVVSPAITANTLGDFLLLSLYVQWVAVSSTLVLCVCRRFLDALSPPRALLAAYLILLSVAVLVAELTIWAVWATGWILSPRPEWYMYFHIQNLTVAAIVDALALRFLLARHELRRSSAAAANARLAALKYRIRPHFLFNSMNIISGLVRRSPARAETAIEDMADVFRLMLDDSKDLVTVSNDLDVARKYLALEKLRLDRRLKYSVELGTVARTARVPVLTIQLLIEQVILQGIENHQKGGELVLSVDTRDERLYVRVAGPARRGEPVSPAPPSGALRELRQRLASHYGKAAVLQITDTAEIFEVSVELPAYGGAT